MVQFCPAFSIRTKKKEIHRQLSFRYFCTVMGIRRSKNIWNCEYEYLFQSLLTTIIFPRIQQIIIIHRSHAKTFSFGFIRVYCIVQTKYFIEIFVAAVAAIEILFDLMTTKKFMSCQRSDIILYISTYRNYVDAYKQLLCE